jgi:hypothetical protein
LFNPLDELVHVRSDVLSVSRTATTTATATATATANGNGSGKATAGRRSGCSDLREELVLALRVVC